MNLIFQTYFFKNQVQIDMALEFYNFMYSKMDRESFQEHQVEKSMTHAINYSGNRSTLRRRKMMPGWKIKLPWMAFLWPDIHFSLFHNNVSWVQNYLGHKTTLQIHTIEIFLNFEKVILSVMTLTHLDYTVVPRPTLSLCSQKT